MTTTSTPRVDIAPELVELVRRIGGAVTTSELHYQLRRRGRTVSASELTIALSDAEARGLITPHAWTLPTSAPPQP
jgi:hypothetical protein